MGNKLPGVQITGVQITASGKIRIWFKWEGKRVFERLDLPATPANLRHAAKLRADVVQRIKLNAFNYCDVFPDSPRCRKRKNDTKTVYDVALVWLDVNRHLARSTQIGYRKIINRYLIPTLGTVPVDAVTHSDGKTSTGTWSC